MSEVFEIAKKTEIKLKLYGKEYSLRRPSVSDAEALSKFTDDSITDSDRLEKTIDLMHALGLPKDECKSMELEHFTKVVEHVFGTVKKN